MKSILQKIKLVSVLILVIIIFPKTYSTELNTFNSNKNTNKKVIQHIVDPKGELPKIIGNFVNKWFWCCFRSNKNIKYFWKIKKDIKLDKSYNKNINLFFEEKDYNENNLSFGKKDKVKNILIKNNNNILNESSIWSDSINTDDIEYLVKWDLSIGTNSIFEFDTQKNGSFYKKIDFYENQSESNSYSSYYNNTSYENLKIKELDPSSIESSFDEVKIKY